MKITENACFSCGRSNFSFISGDCKLNITFIHDIYEFILPASLCNHISSLTQFSNTFQYINNTPINCSLRYCNRSILMDKCVPESQKMFHVPQILAAATNNCEPSSRAILSRFANFRYTIPVPRFLQFRSSKILIVAIKLLISYATRDGLKGLIKQLPAKQLNSDFIYFRPVSSMCVY